jgi:hypothetical protein
MMREGGRRDRAVTERERERERKFLSAKYINPWNNGFPQRKKAISSLISL